MRGVVSRWLITCKEDDSPLEHGCVMVGDDGRIADVGPINELKSKHPSVEWERLNAVVIPGLVNAHTHLELSALRGCVPEGGGFVHWARAMQALRLQQLPEQNETGIAQAIDSLVATGTVAVGEVTNSLATATALRRSSLYGWVFHEVFGFTNEASQKSFDERSNDLSVHERVNADDAGSRKPNGNLPSALQHSLAPHSLFSVHRGVIEQIVEKNVGASHLTSLHLAEHEDERAYLERGDGPLFDAFERMDISKSDRVWVPEKGPVDYANALGLLNPTSLLVHLADATHEELIAVADSKARVVLCPRSNWYIQRRWPPLDAILALGIKPGLGTDSLASNHTLNVLDEVRAVHRAFPHIPFTALFSMATLWGAQSLGLERHLGSIEIGKLAHLCAFELDDHAVVSGRDAYRFVLETAKMPQVWHCPGAC